MNAIGSGQIRYDPAYSCKMPRPDSAVAAGAFALAGWGKGRLTAIRASGLAKGNASIARAGDRRCP